MIITIDGTAGTGKTTVAKRVAEALHFAYFDTGAMYRSITWLFLQNGISADNEKGIKETLKNFNFHIDFENGEKRYFVDEADVTEAIRSLEVTNAVSGFAALRPIREVVWDIQRNSACGKDAVFEGRDMGTVVFPKAELKIFLTASPEVRAQRRLKELREKPNGEAIDPNQLLQEMKERDERDSTRKLAPLKQAKDAHTVDTSDLTIDEVVNTILRIKERVAPAKKRKGHLFYRFILTLAKCYFKIFHRHKVYGRENFHNGGALIASNHTSFYDPPILAISWPEEVHFLARESLFNNFLFGRLIRSLNSHPVKGTAKDIGVLKTICSLLSEDKKVILFPEGKRTENGKLGTVKPGIAFLIMRTKKAIVPAYIDGAYQAWGRKRKLPKLFGKTVCVFGTPILYQEFAHLSKKEADDAIGDRFKSRVLELKSWFENGANGSPP